MNGNSFEECPVCWRSFSSSIVPVAIICGHSYCEECSERLRSCPLCRIPLKKGYSKSTNFSLLSLVSKLENDKKDMMNKEVQTDMSLLNQVHTRPLKERSRKESNQALVVLHIIMKLTSIQNQLGKWMVQNSKNDRN